MSRIIHKKIFLEINASEAFDMFIIKRKVETWLCAEAEIDAKLHGKYELYWDPQNRMTNNTVGCIITAFDYGKILAFDWKGPMNLKMMNTINPLTHVVISFLPVEKEGIEGTEIHLIHSGWRNTPPWEQARLWFEEAWKNAFNSLELRCKKKEKRNIW